MEWYSGTINDAVKTSKLNRAVFVVFIAGKDEISTEITKVIDTPEISSCLKKDDFVAIKLESGTEEHYFFAQIYKFVPIPSLFFIGHDGQPAEIVAGSVTASYLKDKINTVLTKLGKGKSNISNTSINIEESVASTSSTPQLFTSSSDSTSNQLINGIVENSMADIAPTVTNVKDKSEPIEADTLNARNDNQLNQQLTNTEKVERARKLIESQKQQQMEIEMETEKRRELERRNIGKHVQNARRRQQDMELALAHEEKIKEKALEREARERVMQQIAQDKLERKRREQALVQQVVVNQQNQEQSQSAQMFAGEGVARIQFRLPSGNPHMGKFEATTTLQELRAYVSGNIDLPFRQFSMSMSFPRRDLTAEDDEKTLLELELVPTAVILILPVKHFGGSTVAASHDDSFLSRFMWALLAPLLTVYNYLTGYFFGGQNGGTNSQSNDSTASNRFERSGAFGANNFGQSFDIIGRNIGSTNRDIRARGNIHRLHSGADDNDENNTWNGNSTQQL